MRGSESEREKNERVEAGKRRDTGGGENRISVKRRVRGEKRGEYEV